MCMGRVIIVLKITSALWSQTSVGFRLAAAYNTLVAFREFCGRSPAVYLRPDCPQQ
jgi:hypothetical protein